MALSHAAGLYLHLTGRENVLCFGEHGTGSPERERRADELIEMLTCATASRRAKGFAGPALPKTALGALVAPPAQRRVNEPTNGLT